MASFEVGMLFASYKEFKAKVDEYQTQNSVQLFIKSSETVEAARRKFPERYVNEALVYHHIRFGCSDCFKNKNYFKSIDVQFDIEMNLRLNVTKDGRHLEITKLNLKHSHHVGKASKLPAISTARWKKENVAVSVGNVKVQTAVTERKSPGPKRKRKAFLDCIDIGKQSERWQSLKGHLSIISDEELAEILLNHFEKDLNIATPGCMNSSATTGTSFPSGNQLSAHDTSCVVKVKDEFGKSSINMQARRFFENGNEAFHALSKSNNYEFGCKASSSSSKSVSETVDHKEIVIIDDEDDSVQEVESSFTFNKNLKPKTEPSEAIDNPDHGVHKTINTDSNKVYIPAVLPKREEMLSQVTSTHCFPFQQHEITSQNKEFKRLHDCSNQIHQKDLSGDSSRAKIPMINLGNQLERWESLKQKLHIGSDEDLAKFLIDRDLG